MENSKENEEKEAQGRASQIVGLQNENRKASI